MRLELPWYDLNYRDSSDYNTPAGKKIAELNDFLEKNGIKWWIKLLNDSAVLELDNSVSPEKIEEIKTMVSELLRIMWATETQLSDVFKEKKRLNKMGDYEKEKFESMRDKFVSLIKIMDDIEENSSKADALRIKVDRDSPFFEIYEACWFGDTGKKINFNDLWDKLLSHSYKLQSAIKKGVKSRYTVVENLSDYEKEKFDSMKLSLVRMVEHMDMIEEYSKKADDLGIFVKKDFTFDEIYRTWWFQGSHWSVNLDDLSNKFRRYSYKLQEEVAKKENWE